MQDHCLQQPQQQQVLLLLLLLLAAIVPSLIVPCTGLRFLGYHSTENKLARVPQQHKHHRSLQQVPAAQATTLNSTTPQPAAVYPSLQEALNAAVEAGNSSSNTTTGSNGAQVANITTFAAAVKAADLVNGTNNVAWTLLAPTNKAFEKKLPALGGTIDNLLANRTLLMQLLSYHLIPSGAYNSSSMHEGLTLNTALAGAAPLQVTFDQTKKDGTPRKTPQIELEGASNKAKVKVADIIAGRSVIHVISNVLLPPGIDSVAAAAGE
eukprot:gene3068-biopygen4721